jgi:hypothetical protein
MRLSWLMLKHEAWTSWLIAEDLREVISYIVLFIFKISLFRCFQIKSSSVSFDRFTLCNRISLEILIRHLIGLIYLWGYFIIKRIILLPWELLPCWVKIIGTFLIYWLRNILMIRKKLCVKWPLTHNIRKLSVLIGSCV